MNLNDNNDCKVAVIVGRFQSPILLDGHKEIIDTVLDKHFNDTFIILGVPSTKVTKNNPLDFDSRRRMIQEKYPKINILYIKDMNGDIEWSKNLDQMVAEIAGNREVILFGTRENFISRYMGKNETVELQATKYSSESDIRTYSGKKMMNNEAWRCGVVWATQNAYPHVYPTVDCCIFDDDNYEYVWMAKKPNEQKLRFVGGFVDPDDFSFAATAIREAKEETNMSTDVVDIIGTFKIDDWRYRNEQDRIITTLFAMKKNNASTPRADDDISELHKVDVMNLDNDNVQSEHVILLDAVKNWVKNKKKL